MLDLDAFEAFYIERANTQRGRAALSVVAELRAAREAKKRLVKALEYAPYPDADLEALRRIMAGWDEALDEIVRGGGG